MIRGFSVRRTPFAAVALLVGATAIAASPALAAEPRADSGSGAGSAAGAASASGASSASPHASKAPKLELVVFVASNVEEAKRPDAGRAIDPKLVGWNELRSDPLVHYDKLEVLHHVTAPLEPNKPYTYTFPGNGTKYTVTLLGSHPDEADASVVDYEVAITLAPVDGKTSTARITRKQGVRMILGGRTYAKPAAKDAPQNTQPSAKPAKLFFSASIAP